MDPARYLPAKEARRISRASQLTVAAAQEAMAMASGQARQFLRVRRAERASGVGEVLMGFAGVLAAAKP